MSTRYPHAYIFDGPSGGAGSGRCRHCGVSDEDESADMECPVRLRQALNEAQAVIAEDDETARLFLDGSSLSVARLTVARDARRPHVEAHKARQGKP